MKRTIVLLVLVFALLAGCGESGAEGDRGSESGGSSGGNGSADRSATTNGATEETMGAREVELRDLVIEPSNGKNAKVRVEIADDADEQAQGLMNRKKLGEKRGMLFVFPEERERSFWMKNTYIPLSIAYINSEGRIIDIQDMKPLDDEPPSYVSAEPAQYALEVNKGFFDERGVKVGDEVQLPGR